jgi:hypothetical protein
VQQAGIDNSLTTLGVYPNPTIGNRFNVNFSSNTAQPLVLKVIEISTGRIVKTQFINAAKGANQVAVALDYAASTSGLYAVTLEGDGVKYNASKLMMNRK